MDFFCASRTHVGLRRKLNEDAFLVSPDTGLWVVADGMGGHEAGDIASRMIVEAIGALPDVAFEGPEAALRAVNAALVRLAAQRYGERTVGSTAVVLSVKDSAYRCLWVGDSRAYLLRSGKLGQLTRDHSLVQDLVDAGMLNAEDAEGHPNANVVTRAVGASTDLQVDVVTGTIMHGDLFLLASDGLTRVVPHDDLHRILSTGTLEQKADRLIARTLESGAPDNVTIVLIEAR
ncbi:PP2C family protein-serine/threonine phosphatase [Croceicoccus bisphenolivorans]|uniref:PP2C family protein-serine/threonine phosphatase n=1 Tax=Croceicoccus bisphenolivorans TaxID=1783232 RepID=UPI00082C4A2A|nr:protein phosphatase 2C domain-containing protein [Croceicoccus bisphenolivorans]